MIRIGIVGTPFTDIELNPIDSLVGIRPRSWALFTLLNRHGFQTCMYVEPEARVHPLIESEYGERFIRSRDEFLRKSGDGTFRFTIFSTTQLQALLTWHPWLKRMRNARIMGAFCYDNNRELDPEITAQMIGTTFTTPLQKEQWDSRNTGVASFLITTGQTGQYQSASVSDGNAAFIGFIHSIRTLELLIKTAALVPDRLIYLVSAGIREDSGKSEFLLDFSKLDPAEHQTAFDHLISSRNWSRPDNLIYRWIPHGEEGELLDRVTIGLDFSWKSTHNIENSKVSRYLTYGLIPVVQKPAPSYRFLEKFKVGEILDYEDGPTQWAEAIHRVANTPLEVKNKLRLEASDFFSWNNVAEAIGLFLMERTAFQCFSQEKYDECIEWINKISQVVSRESTQITGLRRKVDDIRRRMGLPYIFPAGLGKAQTIDDVYGLLSESDLKALRYCAVNSRGKCVNIGVFEGLSAYYIASCNPGLEVYGVDAYLGMTAQLDRVNHAQANKTRQTLSKLPNAHLIVGLSRDVAGGWKDKIDFLFIDGSHAAKDALEDYESWSPFVKEDGFIAVHDSYKKVNQNIYHLRKQGGGNGPDEVCRRMAEDGNYEFIMIGGCTEVWRKKKMKTVRLSTETAEPQKNLMNSTQMNRQTESSTANLPVQGRLSLKSFAGKYTGRRAFILGNGPSLRKLDLTKLKDEITFGVNSIFYNFEEMGFKPTFYVVEDKLVAEDRASEINELTGMVKIFGSYLKEFLDDREDVIWVNVNFDYRNYPGFPHFSKDADREMWVGGTVSYLCMQLAFYMGFDEIYLIGFDHSYTIPPDAIIEGTVITSSSDDPNHFHRDYFGKGKRWHDPRVDRMEKAYRRAKQLFESDGRKIYNATVGGKLEVFERVDYLSLFRCFPSDVAVRDDLQGRKSMPSFIKKTPAFLEEVKPVILDDKVSEMRTTWDELSKKNKLAYISHLQEGAEWDMEEFELVGSLFVERMIGRFRDYGNTALNGAKVLEIGCGMGRFLKPLSMQIDKVVGIDISEEMLKVANDYCSNSKNITLILGDGKSLMNVESDSFDYCVSAGVFQHITHIDCITNYIKDALRVLKPNGLFLFQFEGTRTEKIGRGTTGAKITAETLTRELRGLPFRICEISRDPQDSVGNIVIVLKKLSQSDNVLQMEQSFCDFEMTEKPWLSGVYDGIKTKTVMHKRQLEKPERITFYDDGNEESGLRISAIVCTYKNPELLIKTIDSLIHQTLNPELYEIIVVDNNSPDHTKDVISRYSRVRYVLEEKLGLSNARNRGIRAARSEIIAFIDDDAEASPGWLEALLKVYDDIPDAWAVGGSALPIWDAPKPEWLTEKYYRSLSLVEWGDITRPLKWPERIIGVNCSFRSRVFKELGNFNSNLGRLGSALLGNEDTEIQQRINAGGYSIYYSPDAIVHHHVPASRMTEEYFRNRAEGTKVSKAIMALRSEGRGDEIELLMNKLRNSLSMHESTIGDRVVKKPNDTVTDQRAAAALMENNRVLQSKPMRNDALIRSREKLAEFRNRHQGERCVIIGNGPSLNQMDMSWLKDEITFGMNKIFLGFDRWEFRPTYYVAVNRYVVEQSVEQIEALSCPRFIGIKGYEHFTDPDKIVFLESTRGPSFSKDIRTGMWEGHTVTYVALQIAYFMGFKEVALIGVDHNFSAEGEEDELITSETPDANHFDPNYFGPGIRWQLPNLKQSELAYQLAKDVFERSGRRIVNATVGGRLELFPRIDYLSWHSSSSNRPDGAGEAFRQALKYNCDGEAEFHRGNFEAARNAYRAALDLKPELAVAHNNLGVTDFVTNNISDAIGHLKRAVELDPMQRSAILNLSDALVAVNDLTGAKNLCADFSRIFPDDDEVSGNLSQLK